MAAFSPGEHVIWIYTPHGHRGRGRRYPFHPKAEVLAVHPHSVHIRVQRFDGSPKSRWVKHNKLRGWQ